MGADRSSRLAVLMLLSLATCAGADVQDAVWLGGAGTFTDASRWSGGIVPNNNATTTFNVLIDAGNAQSSTVTLASNAGTLTVNRVTIDPGDQLQLTASSRLWALQGATVNGAMSLNGGFLFLGSNALLDGAGEIFCPVGNRLSIGSSTGEFASAAMTIGANLHLHAYHGAIGNSFGSFVSLGRITADGAGTLNSPLNLLGATFRNDGTLLIQSGATLSVNVGSYTMADLGNVMNNGGLLRLGGHLYNAGNAINASSALRFDGTVHGGTINVVAGQVLRFDNFFGSTLDEVWINGAIQVNRPLRFAGNHTLQGNNLSVRLIDRIESYIGSIENGGTFTVGDGVTITGTGYIGHGEPVVNFGTIISDAGYVGIDASGFTNHGVLEVRNGGTIAVGQHRSQNINVASLGTMRYGPGGGSFMISGTLDNTGHTLVNGQPVRWWLDETLKGGTLKTLPGNDLAVPSGFTANLDGVTLDNATISVGGWLRVPNGLTGQGHIFGGYIYKQDAPIDIGPDIHIHSGTIGLYGMLNRGTISAENFNYTTEVRIGTVTFNNHVGINQGTLLAANGGRLRLNGQFTKQQLGTLINAGGSLEITSTSVLHNEGQTFDSATLGPWILQGTLRGGTLITSNPSLPLYIDFPNQPAVLDDVAVNGIISIIPNARLWIADGQALHGNGEVRVNYPSAYGSVLRTGSGTFTIDEGMTVSRKGLNDFYYTPAQIGTPGAPFVNHGELLVQLYDGDFEVLGSGAFNDGTISIRSDESVITFRSGLTMEDGGVINARLQQFEPLNVQIFGDLNLIASDDYLFVDTRDLPYGHSSMIITYSGALSGVFDHVGENVSIDYSTAGEIRVTVVPEPAAAGVVAIAAAMGFRLNCRRSRGAIA